MLDAEYFPQILNRLHNMKELTLSSAEVVCTGMFLLPVPFDHSNMLLFRCCPLGLSPSSPPPSFLSLSFEGSLVAPPSFLWSIHRALAGALLFSPCALSLGNLIHQCKLRCHCYTDSSPPVPSPL